MEDHSDVPEAPPGPDDCWDGLDVEPEEGEEDGDPRSFWD